MQTTVVVGFVSRVMSSYWKAVASVMFGGASSMFQSVEEAQAFVQTTTTIPVYWQYSNPTTLVGRIEIQMSQYTQWVPGVVGLRAVEGSALYETALTAYALDPADEGGGIWIWTNDTTSVDNAGTIVVPSLLPRTGCWKRVWDAALNVHWFGARGDGATDDTDAIQDTIDFAFASGGATVCLPTATYLVSKKLSVGCVQLKSNVQLQGQGSTLLLADAQSCPVLVIANASRICVSDLVIDGNFVNQVRNTGIEQGCFYIYDSSLISVVGYTGKNCLCYALRALTVTDSMFDRLVCENSDGSAFTAGTYTKEVRRCWFGSIVARYCSGNSDVLHDIGSVFGLAGIDCTIDSIVAQDCFFGIKIQDSSERVSVGSIVLDTIDGYSCAGVKVEGGSPGVPNPTQITIGSIVAKSTWFAALYVEQASDVSVGSVVCDGCGTGTSHMPGGVPTGPYYDVWIHGDRVKVGPIVSKNASAGGVLVRTGSTSVAIENITCSTPVATAYALNVEANAEIVVGSIDASSLYGAILLQPNAIAKITGRIDGNTYGQYQIVTDVTSVLYRQAGALTSNQSFSPNVADGASGHYDFTVTGAASGDMVQVGVGCPSGVVVTAQVSALNTVSVSIVNHSGSLWNPGPVPCKMMVNKFLFPNA